MEKFEDLEGENVHNAAVAILAAGAALGDPKRGENKEAKPYAIVPPAHGLMYLEELDRPSRKTGVVTLNDPASFVEYFNRHTQDSVIYASLSPAQFKGVLNDHTGSSADWGDHIALFTLKHSTEWKAWIDRNGKHKAFQGNVDFAEWLEDRSYDMVSPTGADMLQLALSFKVNSNIQFANATRLTDGHTEFTFNNVIEGGARTAIGGKIQIPDKFTISIPVWDGPEVKKYEMEARFRYRLAGATLSIWYEFIRPDKVIEQAFFDVYERIKTDAKALIVYGSV